MRSIIAIPARYGSTRFPGKPLALIAGRSLLERVWRIATKVQPAADVIVATDDARIKEAAEKFGARVVMTSTECSNGSVRVYQAVASLPEQYDVVVNLQGDAPLTPPWVIEEILAAMKSDVSVQIATPAVQLSQAQYAHMQSSKQKGIVSGTTVTFAANGDAMYFSKAILPFFKRKVVSDPVPVYQHIGLYAYKTPTLKRYIDLPEGMFEHVEDLEQLRSLEHGIPIRVVKVSLQGRTLWPIDSPEDVATAERIIHSEGELA
jgi:3-deoxy-manno-octulosonate cytidylyltransferase (CMP-KDO synthetase)